MGKGGGDAGFPPCASALSPYTSPTPGVSDTKDWKDQTGLPRHEVVEGGLGVVGPPGALLRSPPPTPPTPGTGLAVPLDVAVGISSLGRFAGGSLSCASSPLVKSMTVGCCLNCAWDTDVGTFASDWA